MEVRVDYRDYSKEVNSATIVLGDDQWVRIGYTEEIELLEPVGEEEPVEEVVKKIEIKHIDDTLMSEISNVMSLDDIAKYIALLQRFARQL